MKAIAIQIFLVSIGTLFSALGQNPIPFLEQPLNPMTVHAGAPGLTLRLTGAGYVAGSVVNWNSTPLATTFVSNRQLMASVPAALIASAGTAMITVTNPAPKGGPSNAVPFEVSRVQTGVNYAPVFHATGAEPLAVAVADFNRDGRPDLAVANSGANTVSILLGNGDGTFQLPVNYNGLPNGQQASAISAADLNNDGKLDLAVVSYDFQGNGGVFTMLGNGDGTFGSPSALITVGQFPRFLTSADFNGDGNMDLAVPNYDSGTVSILLGHGDGTFAPKVDYATSVNPVFVVASDLHNHGKLDLAVTDRNSGITILKGAGDGTFLAGGSVFTSSGNFGLAIADLNSDGKQDLISTEVGPLSIYLNLGAGAFGSGVNYPLQNAGLAVEAVMGDFNADGKLDVAVADESGAVQTFLGNGDGTLQSPLRGPVGGAPLGIAAGDFNGDGRLDLVVTDQFNAGVYVMLQTTLQLSTTSLSFSFQKVGTTSPPQKIVFTDTSGTLSLGSITTAGTDAGDFVVDRGCGTTLQVNQRCSVNINFKPTATGPRQATLNIVNQTLGVTQTIALSGTGK